jgi:hypothetical protein
VGAGDSWKISVRTKQNGTAFHGAAQRNGLVRFVCVLSVCFTSVVFAVGWWRLHHFIFVLLFRKEEDNVDYCCPCAGLRGCG